jgi:cytochrome c peroxidase
VFRASPLRNIDETAPYFHSGKVWDLKVAVQIMGTSQLGTEVDDAQADRIVAFLGALTGKMPEVVYPVLPPETLSTPRPTGEVK